MVFKCPDSYSVTATPCPQTLNHHTWTRLGHDLKTDSILNPSKAMSWKYPLIKNKTIESRKNPYLGVKVASGELSEFSLPSPSVWLGPCGQVLAMQTWGMAWPPLERLSPQDGFLVGVDSPVCNQSVKQVLRGHQAAAFLASWPNGATTPGEYMDILPFQSLTTTLCGSPCQRCSGLRESQGWFLPPHTVDQSEANVPKGPSLGDQGRKFHCLPPENNFIKAKLQKTLETFMHW
jgi:hypothetical protein